MAKVGVILVAAGKSSRFQDDVKKPYADIDGRAVWLRAADLFTSRNDVIQTVLVVAAEDEENIRRRYGPNMAFMNIQLTLGGSERAESVLAGLKQLKPDVDLVAIHDAVRPCATAEMIEAVISQGAETGAAILAAPIVDTIKRSTKDQTIAETVSREHLWLAQTPQVFRKDWLISAYEKRTTIAPKATDDAEIIAAAGHTVHLVTSDLSNLKITTKSDQYLADAILKSRPKPKTRAIHPFADEARW
jgi:2-C-methyl-D-erythritol 4-phosphate cytidylyltransferase